MTDNRPYIEIHFTGNSVQDPSNQNSLIGNNVVIDFGDGTIINYNRTYNHTYATSGNYIIKIYGVGQIDEYCFVMFEGVESIALCEGITFMGEMSIAYCPNLKEITLSESIGQIGNYAFMNNSNLEKINLNWTSSNNIIQYKSNWVDGSSNFIFSIPHGTTSLYSAKGYPTAKLVERSPTVSSHELFTDVKTLFLNNKEVESITYSGGIIYQKEHTNVTLTTTATNNTITYGDSFVLNGLVSNINGASVKLYQNDTLIDTLITDSNGSFTKTVTGLNARSYTYRAVYDGDTNNPNGSSLSVIITVNKATPVLTLSSDKSVIHYNETVTLTGTTTIDGTIKIYQTGEATPLSSIESNNGTFTYTFTNQSQDNIQIYANIESTSNYNQALSNILNLTYNEYYSTNLTIEVPALVYSDVFDVTGVLTDENNNGVSGKSVKLIRDGSILEATETTDSNGEVTFHRSAPTSITTYNFQLVFDGDSSYNNSSSSVVSRTVGKETSILNIESPLDESTYINNGNKIPVSGNLSDNDGTPLENKNIQIKKNNNLITTRTTTEEGDFIGVIPLEFLDIGRNELDFIFNEEEFYTGSTQTVTVNIQEETTSTPSSLTLNSNRNTLSYLHNESATLTATVLDENDNPCADELVVFNVDGTTSNAQTNSNGVATTTYNSNNGGEIYVTATCSNVQDSITINDIYYYNSGAELSKMSDFNVSGRWSAKNTSVGNVTCTTDETEWLNITASGLSNYGHIPITPLIGLNQPFKLSCIIKDAVRDDRGSGGTYVSTYSGFYACRSSGGYGILVQWHPFRIPRSDKGSSDNWSIKSSAQNPTNGTYKYEVTFNGSSITHKLYYLDGSVYKTASVNISDLNNTNYSIEYGISYDNQRSFDIKDIKAELI